MQTGRGRCQWFTAHSTRTCKHKQMMKFKRDLHSWGWALQEECCASHQLVKVANMRRVQVSPQVTQERVGDFRSTIMFLCF